MAITIDCAVRGPHVLGEGPLWNAREQTLYFVDIKGRRLHALPSNGPARSWPTPALLSCVALTPQGNLVGALGNAICRLEIGPSDTELVASEITRLDDLPPYSRFNDGKVAPDGALWVGTMDDEEIRADGCWWRFSGDGTAEKIDVGYGVTNGPAFDETSGLAYMTDSASRSLFVTDGWDAAACERKRLLRQFTEADGYPDGMTIDADGLLWAAFWDGGCVRALDPMTGATVAQIDLPVKRPTSCTFGGPNHEILYVTSASIGIATGEGLEGAVLALAIDGVHGRPPATLSTLFDARI